MKKYLFATLICFSSMGFAAEHSAKLGQVDSASGRPNCDAPEVAGCGPCFKACIEQHGSDRGIEDVSSGSSKASKSNKKSNSTKQ